MSECTCGCCTGSRAMSAFVGGGFLTASIVGKFFSKDSNWPLVITIVGGLAMMFLLRYLDRRERRKKARA